MSRLLYFDCFSGVSGDMFIGALLDAGLPFEALQAALGSLAVSPESTSVERVWRSGIAATKFRVRGEGGASPAGRAGHGRAHGGDAPHAHAHHGETGEHGHHAHEGDVAPHRLEHAHAVGEPHPHRHEGDAAGHRHDHAHRGQAGEHGHHAHEGDCHPADHGHRSLAEIEELVEGSALSPVGKARTRKLFRRLAEVEAAIHGIPIDRVHLHEVGALDSIIDIAGAVFAMEWFGARHVVASPLNVGSGSVRTAHGLLPVPAPATAALLAGVPVLSNGAAGELVTPTGALLITEFAERYDVMPPMTIDRVGYGAGDRELPGMPNVLRVIVGEAATVRQPGDQVVVVECEIDDMNPQIFGVLMDRLYAAGALEVYYTAVQMKKGRPGTLVTVVAAPHRIDGVAEVLFRETTTIGLRYQEVTRSCLAREVVVVETPAGPVRVKLARHGGAIVNATPEFDDCVDRARAAGLPVKQVQAMAVKAFGEREAV